jgi:hypothetical protein
MNSFISEFGTLLTDTVHITWDSSVLGRDAVSLGVWLLRCQRLVVSSSSRVKQSLRKACLILEHEDTTFLGNTDLLPIISQRTRILKRKWGCKFYRLIHVTDKQKM